MSPVTRSIDPYTYTAKRYTYSYPMGLRHAGEASVRFGEGQSDGVRGRERVRERERRLRRSGPALLLAILLIAAGCSSPADSRTAGAAPPAPVAAPVSVTVASVTVRPTTRLLKLVGTLYGAEEVTLSSQVEGQIHAIRADLGDRVEAGQVVAEIEDDQLRARLRVLEATLDKARADEARGRQLVGQKIISPQEYEAMKTSAAVAEARREELQRLLRHATVRSPLTGSIAQRMVSEGEYVRPGTALFELVADDSLKLRGDVPERFASDLQTGQVVQIGVEAYPDTVFTGRVERISPAANPQNRSITVEALVDNRERKLKPGFFANASIVTRTDEQALLVPEQAVITFAGVTKVFVVRDGVARQTLVRTGSRGGDGMVEIVDGVYPDEIVVTSGFGKLEDGAEVSVRAPNG